MRYQQWFRSLLTVSAVAGLSVWPSGAAPSDVDGVERYLDAVRDEPEQLGAFLREMPKGADLHTHLTGAVSTETLLRFAVEDGLCLDTTTHKATAPPCVQGQRPASDTMSVRGLYDKVIAAWSMKGFVQCGPWRWWSCSEESGHDHFFATFKKFTDAWNGHEGEMLAEVAVRAVSQHEYYLEPLITQGFSAVAELAEDVGFHSDLEEMRNLMMGHKTEAGANVMDGIVADVSSEVDTIFARYRSVLRCQSRAPEPACSLPIRFDHQVRRTESPGVVFAQLLLGFELMERDPRYVGVNLVSPEDSEKALDNYRLHMQMVGFLRDVYAKDHVTLHAGELTAAVAPPEDLRFHIRDAVLTAHADRIGHGVDIAGEDGANNLLSTMRQRHVLVEIAFTSNNQILGVSGDDHPFTLYRRTGVPVTLVTDDEGVSRTDLTAQYQQAASVYGLSYRDLKTMARAALQHGFLQGADLWRAPDDFRLGSACAPSITAASPAPDPPAAPSSSRAPRRQQSGVRRQASPTSNANTGVEPAGGSTRGSTAADSPTMRPGSTPKSRQPRDLPAGRRVLGPPPRKRRRLVRTPPLLDAGVVLAAAAGRGSPRRRR